MESKRQERKWNPKPTSFKSLKVDAFSKWPSAISCLSKRFSNWRIDRGTLALTQILMPKLKIVKVKCQERWRYRMLTSLSKLLMPINPWNERIIKRRSQSFYTEKQKIWRSQREIKLTQCWLSITSYVNLSFHSESLPNLPRKQVLTPPVMLMKIKCKVLTLFLEKTRKPVCQNLSS